MGREDAIKEYTDALAEGPGSPALASIVTGQRGLGETLLLNQLEAQASALGWLVISETANIGLIRRLTTGHLPHLLRGSQ